jgi:hypothetical protein
MTRTTAVTASLIAAVVSLSALPASAMTIREFRKFSTTEQSMYIGAAVSMLAYTYAANGDVTKGRCVQNWYFGQRGVETPGPHDITYKLDAYESIDPDKYHVEGVILGVTDKVCGAGASQVKPKQ